MSNMKYKELIITLSCRGEEIYSLNTKDFVEEISIGRSSDCAWSVGHVDSSTSSRHAVISRRKHDFYLTDLGSRNGIFCDNRKIKEIKLVPGLLIRLGESCISVADPAAQKKAKSRVCYLSYTDERGKRCKFKITSDSVKIGAGEKCDIVLDSGLVSTPHASLVRKSDGSFWVRDRNSRNGTSVNGLELSGKMERMLKNGDIISIADIELTFYDGSSEKHALKLTVALLTLFITALVCVGGYYVLLQFTPASQAFLKQARSVARKADFAEARRLVSYAASARKSGETRAERRLFLAQLEVWENALKRLKQLHFLLANKRFSEVSPLLGSMDLDYISAWDWNEKNAVRIKQDLELIKKLFACFNRVDMVFNDKEADPAELDVLYKEINRISSGLKHRKARSQQELFKFSGNVSRKVMSIKKAYGSLQKAMDVLRSSSPGNVGKVIAQFESLQKNYQLPFITGRVENVLPVLYALQNFERQVAACERLFLEMRFKECMSAAVPVPDNNALLLPGVDRQIAALSRKSSELKNIASLLYILQDSLEKQNIRPGRSVPALTSFLRKKELAQVFSCDTLRFAPVSKNRKKASGQYDKYVCIEYLYGVLSMLRSNESVRSRFIIPFESILERAVSQVGMIMYFKDYAEKNCRPYIRRGKLGRYMDYLDSQILLRDRIVRNMKQTAAAAGKNKRAYYIAHGIAYALNPESYAAAEREKISREFSAFRNRMQELNRKYNTVLPGEAIRIREKILKEGLPGDPAVKRMWSLR